ncbi:MAG: hypothetical protein Kow0090_22210 [Myxococcota bacterium]
MKLRDISLTLGAIVALAASGEALGKWTQVAQKMNQDNQYITVTAWDDTSAAAGGIENVNGNSNTYAQYTTNGTTWSQANFGSGGGGGGLPIPAIPGKMSLGSKKTGYAIDLFLGKVLKTTDGGASWADETIPAGGGLMGGASFKDIHAIDANTAWAVGTKGLMLRRGYGGTGWEEVKGFKESFGEVDLIKVNFANKARGYALSRAEDEEDTTIYYTRNGGGVWEKLSKVPYKLFSLSFGSCETLFAGSEKNKIGCILKSTDGGVHWDENCNLPPYPLKNPFNGETSDMPQMWVGDIVMFDENTGFALSHYHQCEDCDPQTDEGCEACNMGKYFSSILLTADGGKTWYRDETFDPAGGGNEMFAARGFISLACGTKNTCYTVGYYLTVMRWTRDNPVADDGSWKTKECSTSSIPDAGVVDDDDDDTSMDGGWDDGGGASDDDDVDNSGDKDDDNSMPWLDDDDSYNADKREKIDDDSAKDGGCGCRVR